MLEDIDKETVDFAPNYDGSEKEPTVLPTRLPNLLVNGSAGIAVGMATNIPPHNLNEIVDACLHLLKNPEATIDELMEIVPAPDFPTAGIIYGLNGVREGYRTGRGKVVMRAKCHFEDIDRGSRQAIIVDEIPYQVNKKTLLERIAELVHEKKLEGISHIQDESDKSGMRVVIELKRGEVPEVVLNNLYKQTQLQDTFGINMVALIDGQPRLCNLKQLVEIFLDHRREVVTRRTVYELRKARERGHVLEGLAVALANIDEFIETIKTSPTPPVAKAALMAKGWDSSLVREMLARVEGTAVGGRAAYRPEGLPAHYGLQADGLYRLSDEQAQEILQMRLQRLTGLEQDKIIGEYREVMEHITDLLDILARPERVSAIIGEELGALKQEFGQTKVGARRSLIERNVQELGTEDLITPANAQVVRELVAMLDVEAAAESNTVRMFPLAHASADRVSTILSDVFRQREQAGTTRPEDRLVVTPDLRTNTLVISTSPRSFEIVHSMLQTLDVAEASPAVGLHVIRVDGVDVSALAPRLQNLMRERLEAERRAGGRASPADVFRVEADAANGALIVAASQENLRVINDLIAALVEAGGGTLPEDLRTEIIQANHSRASDLADAIQNLYVSREVQRRGERAVSVIANQRLNALVVSGTDADIAAVRALVDRLDLERVNITQVLDRIELRSANALEVVSLLRAVLAGRPITGRAPSPAERAVHLNYRDQIAEASLDGAILDLVRVEPDLRTNSVVVNAPKPVLELIRAIVIDLDTTRAGERDIRRFRLVNADAEAMGVLLRDLFNLRQQGDAYVLIPTGSGAMPGDDPAMPDMGFGTRVTPVPDQRQQLAITVDPRTNTLIVSGTPEYLDLVQEVVSELDSIEANSRERVVIPLRNAKSADIETVLQNYFRTEADRIRSVLGDQAGSTARQLEQEVTIVGDPSSNQILISASPRYISTVTQIVRELDAPPPQVMIQVLIAEVTIDRERDWGMDFSAGPFGGSMTSINSNPAGAAISSALGVPNFSVSSADFGLMIRALQSQGRLEVLSRPHLTVNNNETAEFNAGEDIAIVTSVDNLDNGRTRANVERRVVGVILNVTPTISGDGFVRLDIAPVISALSQRTTEISEDFSAPIITERRVSTTVTVRDGETVVIGGLLQTRDEDRETRVPILGEIPGIGSIFRTTRRNQTKTELLLILTPRVIVGQSAEDVERLRTLSQEHINRLSNPDAINRMLRDSRDRAEGMGAAAPGALSPPSDSRRSEPRMIIRPGQQ
ncbi:MAG: hypothetical protein KF692_11885 [Cryobacterium sp.]|nr:hypothetical protein [Cryobacterium sp.]